MLPGTDAGSAAIPSATRADCCSTASAAMDRSGRWMRWGYACSAQTPTAWDAAARTTTPLITTVLGASLPAVLRKYRDRQVSLTMRSSSSSSLRAESVSRGLGECRRFRLAARQRLQENQAVGLPVSRRQLRGRTGRNPPSRQMEIAAIPSARGGARQCRRYCPKVWNDA
jgi:hypothetical protein